MIQSGKDKKMARARKAKKSPFDDLNSDFKDKINSATDEEIFTEIKNSALYEQVLRENKKNDEDLQQKQAEAREAGAVYRNGIKECQLSISYAKEILKARGRAMPGEV